MKRAIVVMGKPPRAGSVKTRLGRAIGMDRAAEVYAAFLADVFAMVDRVELDLERVFACALEPGQPLEIASQLAPRSWRAVAQRGNDLGEKIEAARADVFADRVVILGSDSPAMPPSRIEDAFLALETGADAVFGPTEDGGYDLIALPGPRPALLAGIPWSTPEVMAATRRAALQVNLQIVELGLGWDVDELEDLARVEASKEPAARTRAIVRALGLAPR